MYERGRHCDPGGVRMTGTNPDYQPPDLTLVGEEHVKPYRETDGDVGYLWNGAPTLLLTTTGRSTGRAAHVRADLRPRRRRLPRGRVDGWCAQPSVLVPQPHREPGRGDPGAGDRIPVIARTASDDEKPRLWQIVTEVWPNYDVYQSRTDRAIPVVVLSPA